MKYKPHNYIRQENQTFGGFDLSGKKLLAYGKGFLRVPRYCTDCNLRLFPCGKMQYRCKDCQYKAFLKKSREVYSRKHICKNCGNKCTIRSKDYCKVCDNTIRPRGIALINHIRQSAKSLEIIEKLNSQQEK